MGYTFKYNDVKKMLKGVGEERILILKKVIKGSSFVNAYIERKMDKLRNIEPPFIIESTNIYKTKEINDKIYFFVDKNLEDLIESSFSIDFWLSILLPFLKEDVSSSKWIHAEEFIEKKIEKKKLLQLN
jgi:hypothetical protein